MATYADPQTHRRHLTQLVITGAIMLVATGVIAFNFNLASIMADAEAAGAGKRLAATDALVGAVRDMETAQANYLLCGSVGGASHLVACRRAGEDVASRSEDLSRLAAGDAKVPTVVAVARLCKDDTRFVLSECEAGRTLYAVTHVRDGAGKRTSEWFFAEAGELRQGDFDRREAARSRSSRNGTAATLSALAGLILSGAFFGLLLDLIRRQPAATQPNPQQKPQSGRTESLDVVTFTAERPAA